MKQLNDMQKDIAEVMLISLEARQLACKAMTGPESMWLLGRIRRGEINMIEAQKNALKKAIGAKP